MNFVFKVRHISLDMTLVEIGVYWFTRFGIISSLGT